MEPKIVTISMPLPVAQQLLQALEGFLAIAYDAVEAGAAGAMQGSAPMQEAPPVSNQEQEVLDVLANS